jgi:hypothetical protein
VAVGRPVQAGLTIEVTDPAAAARQWAAVLGASAGGDEHAALVELPDHGQWLRFVPVARGRGEGIVEVAIAGLSGAPRQIGGVRFEAAEG